MPPVAGAVAAGVLGSFSVTAAGTLAFNFTLASFLTKTAIALVLGFASSALAPKPKGADTGFSGQASGLTQTLRQPITTRKRVYGNTRVGGSLVFAGATSNNKYLHLVICMADHESESIDELWVNDYSIPTDWLDASGNVNTGRYANRIRIKKHLGGDGQTADSTLVSEVAEWTTNHRLRGITYMYVRLQYDQDKFPGGVPNLSAFIKGYRPYDPRTASDQFTTNSVLFQRDYIADDTIGLNASIRIDDTEVAAQANIADEIVETAALDTAVTAVAASTDIITLEGQVLNLHLGDQVNILSTGDVPAGLAVDTDYYLIPFQYKDTPRVKLAATLDDAMAGIAIDITDAGTGDITLKKIGEPRYHGAGVLDTDNALETNLKELLTATGGRAIYAGGQWRIKAAAYETPTLTLDESDIIDIVTVRTALQKRDTFNSIKGVYRTPFNLDTPSEWPALESSAYITADTEQVWREMDTPYTQRPQTARRIGKIELLKGRQPITTRIACTMQNAIRAQCGNVIMLSLEQFGWESKPFEVTGFNLTPKLDGTNPTIACVLDLRETAAEVFDWETSEESTLDPAPNTTLPDAFNVDIILGLSFNSRPVSTTGSEFIYIMALEWDEHPNEFVKQNGRIEIEFKLSADSVWSPYPPLKGTDTSADIFQASVGDEYDLRIRAVNNLGARSSWVTLLNVSVGSGGGVTETENWGSFDTGSDPLDGMAYDWGSFDTGSDPLDGLEQDWGGFV